VQDFCERIEGSMMPCFVFSKCCVLVDILHLLVYGNPESILHAVRLKSDRMLVRALSDDSKSSIFLPVLLFQWQEAIFIEARLFVESCQ
jgi:hypothetical protein